MLSAALLLLYNRSFCHDCCLKDCPLTVRVKYSLLEPHGSPCLFRLCMLCAHSQAESGAVSTFYCLIFKSGLSWSSVFFLFLIPSPVPCTLNTYLHWLQNIIINLPLDFKVRLQRKGTNCTSNILIKVERKKGRKEERKKERKKEERKKRKKQKKSLTPSPPFNSKG